MSRERPRLTYGDAIKRALSEEQKSEVYGGPTDFMETGSRGFLIGTLPLKEEFALDDAIDLLRQTTIKLYGGYKPSKSDFKQLEKKGYVKVDGLNLEAIKVLPHPGGEEAEEAEKNEADSGSVEATTEMETKTEAEDPEEKVETSEGKDADNAQTEMEDDKTEEAVEENEDDDDGKTEEESSKAETKEHNEEQEKKENEEEETKGHNKEQEKKEKEEETKEDSKDAKAKEGQKKKHETSKERDARRKAKREAEKQKEEAIPRMHSMYKFKAYRTEMRNLMFIMSDVPDPMEVAQAAMELILERKKVFGDAVCQILPVLGVCQFDFQQLEIMCRRTLAPVFDEALEPKSFGVMLIDKLSEPGSEMIYEAVRNTVWSVNPLAWLSSPISEPDVVLRFELIGSKLVLSCLKHFMRYRQYNPTLLADHGQGEGEDDDGGWMSEESKRELAQKRLERERQREEERLREKERQKERAKRQEEAEARRKAREEERKKREEERKERREREKKEQEEKNKASRKSDKEEEKPEKEEDTPKKEEKSKEDDSGVKEGVDEDTPPSKRQKTDSEDLPQEEEETLEASEIESGSKEETPPSKRQRVDSGVDEISKEDEELLLSDDTKVEEEQEKEVQPEEPAETAQKATPTRATRATRTGSKAKAKTNKK
ncbi:dynein heavy chain-like protein pf11_0240 [Plakobranchus ocellatus]|uniref:Dynein heavy chain-like protein pf11_0240 n=1 Tax=Plakobranchus ocellatus TaxID=259542 RepID=A0AAV4D3I2_9GAST|nr:dynein heavy chain-like protein pf11_0240 [Plakobranchus ocellatus]